MRCAKYLVPLNWCLERSQPAEIKQSIVLSAKREREGEKGKEKKKEKEKNENAHKK